jgi:hypothetical protein
VRLRKVRADRVQAGKEKSNMPIAKGCVLIFGFGANAYSEARRREHEASSDSMARA